MLPDNDEPGRNGFPTVEQLRRGILLGTLVRVVSARPGEAPSDTYNWIGQHLILTDYNETEGCIAFTGERVVGGFFCCESERSPYGEDPIPPYDAEIYFAAAPEEVRTIARRELFPNVVQYLGDVQLLDDAIDRGTVDELDEASFVPVITAAFWSEGDTLTAGEPWQEVDHHGAHILRQEFSDADEALVYYHDQELIPSERLDLARRLYERRLATTEAVMRLTAEEYAELVAPGAPQLEPVGRLLAGVGIALP